MHYLYFVLGFFVFSIFVSTQLLVINFYQIYSCLLLHCHFFFLNHTEAPWSDKLICR